MSCLAACVLAQTLLTFSIDHPQPVRFGWKVPVEAVSRGLRLDGDPGAHLQWRLLHENPGGGKGALWAVIEVCGHDGPAKLLMGGTPPLTCGESGTVCVRTIEEGAAESGPTRTETDRWIDGTVDTRVLHTLFEDHHGPVHWLEDGGSIVERRMPVRIRASEWRRIGVLPRGDGAGRRARQELLDAVPRLPGAPGRLGSGDFTRGTEQATVTNLEFDTALGFLRLALSEGDPACLERAQRAARHTLDVDLDVRSGLPFRHGPDHRVARSEPGHVWTTGIALVGAVFGEAEIFEGGLGIAQALAARVLGPEPREGPFDRLRDEAWPLHELEQMLQITDHPSLRRAADAVAGRMLARFDPRLGCLRYGEGETRAGRVYRDRLWLSLGLAVPALEMHATRTGDARALEAVASIRQVGVGLLASGRSGLPLTISLADEAQPSAVWTSRAAEGYLLLEGLTPDALRSALGRSHVRRALEGALDHDHEDLATRFSIAARCAWVAR